MRFEQLDELRTASRSRWQKLDGVTRSELRIRPLQ